MTHERCTHPHSSLIHSPVAWNVTHARFCLVVAAAGNPSKVMALVMPEIVDLWSRHISQVKFGFPGDQLGECMNLPAQRVAQTAA